MEQILNKPIGIEDTTKKDNYLINCGAVSFQCNGADAIRLANQISKMFSMKFNAIGMRSANIVEPNLMSTHERLQLQGKI